MQIKLNELRKLIREEFGRLITTSHLNEATSDVLYGIPFEDPDYKKKISDATEIEFTRDDGSVVMVHVESDPWVSPAEPNVGFRGDWEALILDGEVFPDVEDDTLPPQLLAGDDFLEQLTDNEIKRLEDLVFKTVVDVEVDYYKDSREDY